MTALRVSRTHAPVTALGYGRRLGVWVQGCPLACKGCVAQDTWDEAGGTEVAVDALVEQVRQSIVDGYDGLTVSGGEPLRQPAAVGELLRAVHRLRSEHAVEYDIMLYTGFEPHELDERQLAVVAGADVVVTGRFVITEPTRLIWRGSANQQLCLLTELGRSRYESTVDYEPERAPIQVAVDDEGLWFVGVPREGTLPPLERLLRAQGIGIEGASWRRVRPPGP